ncbi:DUF1294 domain-containing protein [Novosphingobium aerophilum]|uniref:DUF1294 domain-containing protein n=1 Tax=Novosphingobium aerophilum TaxID=2839843 RepID=UPI002E283C45|nr:DUF1294 domain-containing protein [Novosphingobium aerophilum]
MLASLLLLPSLLTLLLFALDKSRASRRTRRRIPERTLLLCAALGGTPGAYAGRWLFRHKTRKQPFVARLHLIAAGQAALIGLAVARAWSG